MTYIPTAVNPADDPSRATVSHRKWELDPATTRLIDAATGPNRPALDLAGLDSLHRPLRLSEHWAGQGPIMVLPPWNLIPRILQKHNNSSPSLVECELVPDNARTGSAGSNSNSSRSDSANSRCESPTQQESPMEPLRMAHRRTEYQEAGLEPAAIEQILSPNAQTARNRSYGSIQRCFATWCESMDLNPREAPAPAIVNFLATQRLAHGWTVNTVLQYRSGILDLLTKEARTKARDHAVYKDYIESVMHDAVIILERGPVDIKPVLDSFRAVPAENLTDMLLARRVCWLLGTLGLMRPADIQRIAADRIRFEEDHVFIPVVGPKERRAGRPIERPVYIARHEDTAICPVRALEVYFERIVIDHLDIKVPHPTLPSHTLVPLMRHAKDRKKALGTDRISNHIQEIMALASNPSGAYASARSVGADLAVNNGVPLEAAMDHANWASPTVFNTHYRRTRIAQAQITAAILGPSGTASISSAESEATDLADQRQEGLPSVAEDSAHAHP
ncbi:hypothetical protein FB639_002770, partial [Coemansia asiatica]